MGEGDVSEPLDGIKGGKRTWQGHHMWGEKQSSQSGVKIAETLPSRTDSFSDIPWSAQRQRLVDQVAQPHPARSAAVNVLNIHFSFYFLHYHTSLSLTLTLWSRWGLTSALTLCQLKLKGTLQCGSAERLRARHSWVRAQLGKSTVSCWPLFSYL